MKHSLPLVEAPRARVAPSPTAPQVLLPVLTDRDPDDHPSPPAALAALLAERAAFLGFLTKRLGDAAGITDAKPFDPYSYGFGAGRNFFPDQRQPGKYPG